MQVKNRRTQKERTDATRALLIATARKHFVEKGYAETSTPDIVTDAAITRGALYHHFEDKRDLFRAVVEAEAEAVAREIDANSPTPDPLAAGSDAYFKSMAVPGRTRLLLIDAPAVLGWAETDAIDARHGRRTLREGLRAAMDDGALIKLPVEPLSVLLSAMFDRGALAIELGTDPKTVNGVIAAIMAGLARKT